MSSQLTPIKYLTSCVVLACVLFVARTVSSSETTKPVSLSAVKPSEMSSTLLHIDSYIGFVLDKSSLAIR